MAVFLAVYVLSMEEVIMDTERFIKENKQILFKNQEWTQLMNEIVETIDYFQELSQLICGRDVQIIRDKKGIKTVVPSIILNSAIQTLYSIKMCTEFGNVADGFILTRKLRDDLLFYLYILVTCKNSDLFSYEPFIKSEKVVHDWIKNELSNLKVFEVIRYISESCECIELFNKYELKTELREIGKTLNNYTHGNGIVFYNRIAMRYHESEIRQIRSKIIYALNYIVVSFSFLLILICPMSVMSMDYIDALEDNQNPIEGSQYWAAPFVSKFLIKHKELLGKSSYDYLCETTIMELK